jgi:hypothetical protein
VWGAGKTGKKSWRRRSKRKKSEKRLVRDRQTKRCMCVREWVLAFWMIYNSFDTELRPPPPFPAHSPPPRQTLLHTYFCHQSLGVAE